MSSQTQSEFPMGTGFFITGTDTGVGKTLVACGLAALFRDSGYKVGVMKPAETGCKEKDGRIFPEDADHLKKASGCEAPIEKICPYQLCEPLAPSVAAEREAIRIDVGHVIDLYNEISAAHDITLVEGAGGLLVPLLPSYTYADLTRVLKLPLLVVAANRLGIINHLLLTLEHASCRDLRVLGYILNQLETQPSLAAATNREALSTMTSIPCLGEIPYIDDWDARSPSLTVIFEENLDTGLLRRLLPRG